MQLGKHGGDIYSVMEKQKLKATEILDFSANINPLGLSPKGREAMLLGLDEIIHYPDPANRELLEVLSRYYAIPQDWLLLGNGAAELLFALARLPKISKAYVPAPGFSEYAEASVSAGLQVLPYYLEQREASFAYPYEKLLQLIKTQPIEEGCLFFMGNPNNPDGTLLNLTAVRSLAQALEGTASYLVLDESFIDFQRDTASFLPYLKSTPNVILLHSLTKFLAVPGLRIGMVMASPMIVESCSRFIPTWSVNRLAQRYTKAAMQDIAYLEASRETLLKEKERIYALYQGLPFIKPYEPSVNFMLMNWRSKDISIAVLQEFLLERGILIRNCANYNGLGEGWFRIAIKKEIENNRLYEAIKEFGNEYDLLSQTW